jgi:hypothetical protein
MSQVTLLLNLAQAEMDDEETAEFTQNLRRDLRNMDEVNDALPVTLDHAPEGSKAMGDLVLGALKLLLDKDNVGSVFDYLKNRLGSKTVELELEANGKKLKLKASSAAEVEAVLQAAQAFVAAE